MDNVKNILVMVRDLVYVPVIVFLVAAPALIVMSVRPQEIVSNTSDSRTSSAVLGVQQYRISDVSVSSARTVENNLSYNGNLNRLEFVARNNIGSKHTKYENVLVFENQSDEWKQLTVVPRMDLAPTDTEIAVTIGNVSNVVMDNEGNINSAQISIAPNEAVSVGFRMDSLNEIHYSFEIIYDIVITEQQE